MQVSIQHKLHYKRNKAVNNNCCFRLKYELADRYTSNESSGGLLQLFIEDRIDVAFSVLVMSPERLRFYTPVMKLFNMR